MAKMRRRTPWRYIRPIVFGIVATVIFVWIPVATMAVYSYRPGDELPKNRITSPTYLGDLIPPFASAIRTHNNGIELPSGVRHAWMAFGKDGIVYEYGNGSAERWDAEVHGTVPPRATIHRSRFGWPFRALAADDYGCAPGADRQATQAFFDAALDRAGFRYGIKYPGWLPAVDHSDLRRIPLIPLWGGLVANVLAFAMIWYAPGAAKRAFLRHRRKSRGLCLWCAHELAGLDQCPECGEPAHAASRSIRS